MYKYNHDKTIRTSDSIERYCQTTPDNNQVVVAYINEVEYRSPSGAWKPQGFRWAVVEPHLTEQEVLEWLLCNGLSTVPFIRK